MQSIKKEKEKNTNLIENKNEYITFNNEVMYEQEVTNKQEVKLN